MAGVLALVLALGTATGAAPAQAQAAPAEAPAARQGQSGLPLPRFVTLRASKVNLRTGPGVRYPIEWVYTREGMPLEIIDEFETWRRVRDFQASVGWVHQSMLAGDRGVLVVGKQRLMRRDPGDNAPGLAVVEAGVVGRLESCADGWCRIRVKGFEGWLRRDEIYGVYPTETVE